MNLYEISHLSGLRLNRHDGQFGIEIETETLEDYQIPKMKFWTVENDGSLRNVGREYISKGPLSLGGQLEGALEEFKSSTKDIKFIEGSYSTSVHVHVNMLNRSLLHLNNFIVLYTLVENLLLEYAGDDRKSNLFCLPMRDAEGNVNNIETFLTYLNSSRSVDAFRSLNNASMKYAALNIAPMGNIGSLEFRSFRGVTDIKDIIQWVKIIQKIVDYSQMDGLTPPRIIFKWREGTKPFLEDLFGDLYHLVSHPNEKELVSSNVWFAYKFARTCKDWTTINEAYKPKPRMKKTHWDNVKKMAANDMAIDDVDNIIDDHGARFEPFAQVQPIIDGVQRAEFERLRNEMARQINRARAERGEQEVHFVGEDM